MATLYKRKGSDNWQIQYTGPDGKRLQKSAGTENRQAAKELAAKLEADEWVRARLGNRPRYNWQAAVLRWLEENQEQRALEDAKSILRWLDKHLGGLYLDAIGHEVVDQVRRAKLAEGVKAGTVNRHMAIMRSVLNKARKWGWIETVPHIGTEKGETARIRWLTPEEAEKLLSLLPDHLSEMASFALSTGLRESNITGLCWDQIDMVRKCAWIHADQSKNKKPFPVPLNDDALSVLRRQIGKHITHVFTYKGEPVKRCNNHGWRTAVKKSGLEDVCWHTLRHTWASWHIQNGTPAEILQKLGGWSDRTMVDRYAHLSPAHLSEWAANVAVTKTLTLQAVKSKNGSNGGT